MSNTTRGIYLSLLTAVISGISIFVNKFAVDAIKPALYFTSVKNVAVAVLIVAIVLATDSSVKTVMTRSDAALYRAKVAGRNRVELAHSAP